MTDEIINQNSAEQVGGQVPDATPKREGYMGAQAPEKITLKVNGQERSMTLDEVRQAAEKAQGADEKFRQASEMRKEAETLKGEAQVGMEIKNLYRKVAVEGTASKEEINRYCDLMQISDEDRQAALEELEGGSGEAPKAQDRGKSSEGKKITMQDILDPESQRALEYAKQASRKEQEENFKEKVLSEVDRAQNLKDIMGRIPPESREEFRKDMYRRIRSEVVARLQSGAKYGPELLGTVVQEEADQIKKFGSLFLRPKQPDLGLGSEGGLDLNELVQDSKPLKRVAGDDENFAENFAKRAIQKALRAVGR